MKLDARNMKQIQRKAKAAGDKALADYKSTSQKEDNIKRGIDKRIAEESRRKELGDLKRKDPALAKCFRKLDGMWSGKGRGFVNHIMVSFLLEDCTKSEIKDKKCVLSDKNVKEGYTSENSDVVLSEKGLEAIKEFAKTNKPRRPKKK